MNYAEDWLQTQESYQDEARGYLAATLVEWLPGTAEAFGDLTMELDEIEMNAVNALAEIFRKADNG